MSFCGKNVIITGGANGIGRCLVHHFWQAGAAVAVVDIDEVAGKWLESQIPKDRFLFFKGDISVKTVLEDFVKVILEKFKTIDVLVNNACLSKKGILSNCSYEDFEYIQRVGVTAPYYLSLLLKDKFSVGASIVNIASTRAFQSQQDTESYTAAKGGIVALTHGLSISLSGKVRVNSVAPGWIETKNYHGTSQLLTTLPLHAPRFPVTSSSSSAEGLAASSPSSPSLSSPSSPSSSSSLSSSLGFSEPDRFQHSSHRVGEPNDIAQIVLFLADDGKASFLTGQNVTVDGGMTKLMVYHDDYGWSYNPS